MAPKSAEEMAGSMREISVSQFFEKNRHLIGYDNKNRALLTVIKEAVDNSLDACQEAGMKPDILVKIQEMADDKIKLYVEDNGPGIPKDKLPNVFGKLLYGSKFHRLRQSRGQQGIGISGAVLYAQLTTNKPTWVASKTGADKPTNTLKLMLDTARNQAEIIEEKVDNDALKHQGTAVEMIIESKYKKGDQSVDEFLRQTAIANPYAKITLVVPGKDGQEKIVFPRVIDELPPQPKEIKPHPYGTELGTLRQMLKTSSTRSLQGFLTGEFSRVGDDSAKEICAKAKLDPKMKPEDVPQDQIEKLRKAMQEVKLMKPPTDCLAPIGEVALAEGLKKELQAEFVATVTRSPAVYSGRPFQIEAAVAYGGPNLQVEGAAKLIRLANRVPLLYQAGGCATTEAATSTNWKPYGITQTGQNMPQGPVAIFLHIASVWVPFTSESKDAIASNPEILEEMRLALQECGRRIGRYIKGKHSHQERARRMELFERYIPELANVTAELTGEKAEGIKKGLEIILAKNKNNYVETETAEEAGEKEAKKAAAETEDVEEE